MQALASLGFLVQVSLFSLDFQSYPNTQKKYPIWNITVLSKLNNPLKKCSTIMKGLTELS